MYKLFICLKYLRTRAIAYFAMLGVALCVAMMLIVISVMNGFLDKIETAAKGLFGDIVIESISQHGIALYDEFIDELVSREQRVEAASPFIYSYAVLKIPGDNHYRQPIQVAGIRLPQRAEVSDFEKGLFVQSGWAAPSFDPPIKDVLASLVAEGEKTQQILQRQIVAGDGAGDGSDFVVTERLRTALSFQASARFRLAGAEQYQEQIALLQRRLDDAHNKAGGETEDPAVLDLEQRLAELTDKANLLSPKHRAILGMGIQGLSFKTDEGETIRYIVPGHKVVLWVFPLGRGLSLTDISPNAATFTVMDDCKTDVYSIDSGFVYVPFGTLQQLNNMGADYDADDPRKVVNPPRCSQIHIKARDEHAQGRQLADLCHNVERLWADFAARNPKAAIAHVTVQTWRQRQAKVVVPIEKQRDLTVIMFGIISLVSVVLIFVIFYMIVFQKTKDIGILKAIGASSGGVAWIFLAYGAAVGLIGSTLGTTAGYYFVTYINPIQDWLATHFGFRVWSKDVFLFEKIPNEVKPLTALVIALSAIVAGLIGALAPAIRAARMQPVEALRYE